MVLNRFHSNHLIRVLSIVEEEVRVGFIKIRVVITISRFFFFFDVYHCVKYAEIRTFSDFTVFFRI